MSKWDGILNDVVASFSIPHDCRVLKISEDGKEDLIGRNLTWDEAAQLAEEIIPTLKKGQRVSIREGWRLG